MVAGGEQSGYGILTVREQLWMFSQFYGLPRKRRLAPRRRADRGGRAWATQRQQRVSTLSTGQRQKMNFARGLLNDPWILFLDEPTLGLDVAAARSVRELVLAWKAAVPGRTVLLTTHYMAEADELCDRIAIVDHGRILAIGTPDELKKRVQRESIFRLELDRLDGGAGALAPPARRRERGRGRGQDDGDGDRQTVAVNLVLVDDARAGRRGRRARRDRLAHPRPAQVRADARGRLRRARRPRLRGRGRPTAPRPTAAADRRPARPSHEPPTGDEAEPVV